MVVYIPAYRRGGAILEPQDEHDGIVAMVYIYLYLYIYIITSDRGKGGKVKGMSKSRATRAGLYNIYLYIGVVVPSLNQRMSMMASLRGCLTSQGRVPLPATTPSTSTMATAKKKCLVFNFKTYKLNFKLIECLILNISKTF